MKTNMLFLIIITGIFVGCSDDEGLVPSNIDRDRYNVADFSTQEEMDIRNSFYDKTGCYIVFNDSLAKREAITPAGVYTFVDTLDLNYAASYRTEHKFYYTLLPTVDERRVAADFLANEVLPRLDTVFYPYAFFMVDSLRISRHMQDGSMITMKPEETMGSWVCYSVTVVAYGGFGMDVEGRKAQIREIQKGILINTYDTKLDSLDYLDFLSIAEPYRNIEETWWEEGETQEEWSFERGFLYGVWATQSYRLWNNDVAAYIWEIFSMTKDEFDKKYEEWPIILERRDAMVAILEKKNVSVY